jgi:hypothetical protein
MGLAEMGRVHSTRNLGPGRWMLAWVVRRVRVRVGHLQQRRGDAGRGEMPRFSVFFSSVARPQSNREDIVLDR